MDFFINSLMGYKAYITEVFDKVAIYRGFTDGPPKDQPIWPRGGNPNKPDEEPRRPRDTGILVHTMVNRAMREAGLPFDRSKCIFGIQNMSAAAGYGVVCKLVPAEKTGPNRSRLFANRTVDDFYEYIDDHRKHIPIAERVQSIFDKVIGKGEDGNSQYNEYPYSIILRKINQNLTHINIVNKAESELFADLDYIYGKEEYAGALNTKLKQLYDNVIEAYQMLVDKYVDGIEEFQYEDIRKLDDKTEIMMIGPWLVEEA